MISEKVVNFLENPTRQRLVAYQSGKIPAKRVLLVGIGPRETLTLERVRQAMGMAVKRARRVKAKGLACLMPDVPKTIGRLDDVAQAMAEGAVVGDYRFTEYLTDQAEDRKTVANLHLARPNFREPGIWSVLELNEGTYLGKPPVLSEICVIDPANLMKPSRVVAEAKIDCQRIQNSAESVGSPAHEEAWHGWEC